MNMVKRKKGAVELSLNLIIMLVIGLTVLGLIIAFVTNFLGSAEDSFVGKLTEDDKVKIEQVQRESGNFAFLESTLEMEKGTSKKLYIKVRNPTVDEQQVFTGGPLEEASSVDVSEFGFLASQSETGDEADTGAISVQAPPILLKPGEQNGYALKVDIGDSLVVGTYFVTFSIAVGDEVYTEIVTFEVK